MTPILIEGGAHHCDLHARLVAAVETAAHERPGAALPLVLTISTEDERLRVDDHRDVCLEATNGDEVAAEELREVVADICPRDFLPLVAKCVKDAGPRHFSVLPHFLTVRSLSSSHVSRSKVFARIEAPAATGTTVTLKVDALPAVLAVPLVMLVVEELCRANLVATVTLDTMTTPAEADHLAAA